MIIECTTCPVRGTRCDGCMVTAMLAGSGTGMGMASEVTCDAVSDTASRWESDAMSDVAADTTGDAERGAGDPASGRSPEWDRDTAPLDGIERRAVSRLVSAGLVSAADAATARARREPQSRRRAVG